MTPLESFTRSDGTRVEVVLTDLDDGDFHIDGDPASLADRRARVMAGRWAVVRQVHGTRIVDADRTMLIPEADGIVTDAHDQPIAVHGADCAPVAFVTASGPIGVAHIGWRGLEGGMVEEMVRVLGDDGATVDHVVVGSTIGPECYEFGADDLAGLRARYGDAVAGVTSDGRTALDLAAGIETACRQSGVGDVRRTGGCTACGPNGFSHRARADAGRHALVARITD